MVWRKKSSLSMNRTHIFWCVSFFQCTVKLEGGKLVCHTDRFSHIQEIKGGEMVEVCTGDLYTYCSPELRTICKIWTFVIFLFSLGIYFPDPDSRRNHHGQEEQKDLKSLIITGYLNKALIYHNEFVVFLVHCIIHNFFF